MPILQDVTANGFLKILILHSNAGCVQESTHKCFASPTPVLIIARQATRKIIVSLDYISVRRTRLLRLIGKFSKWLDDVITKATPSADCTQ